MVITGAFLADYAEVRGEKLYCEGGAWSDVSRPWPDAYLALLLDTGPDDVGRTYQLVIGVTGPDGEQRDYASGMMPIRQRAMVATMPFPIPPDLGAGRYGFQCRLIGQDRAPAVFGLHVY